ncbi:MAG: hypothetical protein AAGA74_02310 [Pseudomonadota bacterium]
MSEQPQSDSPLKPGETTTTLVSLLSAEANFLKEIREIAKDHLGDTNNAGSILRSLNCEEVFHIARFYFLLGELGCTSLDAIIRLIKNHNKDIEKLIESGNVEIRTQKELEDAIFSDYIILEIKNSFGWNPRPGFTRADLGRLMIEHSSDTKTTEVVDLMIKSGLLTMTEQSQVDSRGKPKGKPRKLVRADGRLENAVRNYLKGIISGIVEPVDISR